MRILQIVLLLLIVFIVAGCGGSGSSSTSVSPAEAQYLGTWSGTWTQATYSNYPAQSGTLTMTVAPVGSNLQAAGQITDSTNGLSGYYLSSGVIAVTTEMEPGVFSTLSGGSGTFPIAWSGSLGINSEGQLVSGIGSPTFAGSYDIVNGSAQYTPTVTVVLTKQAN
jgi:hypothetical protein